MRDINLGAEPDERIPHAVGMTPEAMEDMYRLLAIAKYGERYVIPAGHSEQAHSLEGIGSDCPLNAEGGPGMADIPDIDSPGFSGTSGLEDPLAERGAEAPERSRLRGRVNLLNWNGKGRPTGSSPRPRNRREPEMYRPLAFLKKWRTRADEYADGGEGTADGLDEAGLRTVCAVVSWLIDYPDEQLMDRLPQIRALLAAADLPTGSGRTSRPPSTTSTRTTSTG